MHDSARAFTLTGGYEHVRANARAVDPVSTVWRFETKDCYCTSSMDNDYLLCP